MNTRKRKLPTKPTQNLKFMPRIGRFPIELVNTLKSVNTSDSDAKANETSMEDNNGGRILYYWLNHFLRKVKKKD